MRQPRLYNRAANMVPASGFPHGTTLSFIELFLCGAPPDILDRFYSICTPDILLRLSGVSSNFRSILNGHFRTTWDISLVLRRWFADWNEFRRLMRKHNAIISGSCALAFFMRTEYSGDTDLDVYVSTAGVLQLGRWLREHGYTFQRTASQPALFEACTVGITQFPRARYSGQTRGTSSASGFEVFHFVRTFASTAAARKYCKIDLIVTEGEPEQQVLSFHSSKSTRCHRPRAV